MGASTAFLLLCGICALSLVKASPFFANKESILFPTSERPPAEDCWPVGTAGPIDSAKDCWLVDTAGPLVLAEECWPVNAAGSPISAEDCWPVDTAGTLISAEGRWSVDTEGAFISAEECRPVDTEGSLISAEGCWPAVFGLLQLSVAELSEELKAEVLLCSSETFCLVWIDCMTAATLMLNACQKQQQQQQQQQHDCLLLWLRTCVWTELQRSKVENNSCKPERNTVILSISYLLPSQQARQHTNLEMIRESGRYLDVGVCVVAKLADCSQAALRARDSHE